MSTDVSREIGWKAVALGPCADRAGELDPLIR